MGLKYPVRREKLLGSGGGFADSPGYHASGNVDSHTFPTGATCKDTESRGKPLMVHRACPHITQTTVHIIHTAMYMFRDAVSEGKPWFIELPHITHTASSHHPHCYVQGRSLPGQAMVHRARPHRAARPGAGQSGGPLRPPCKPLPQHNDCHGKGAALSSWVGEWGICSQRILSVDTGLKI